LALALGACNNTLPKATSIVHMRVLGAQTAVVGDPARATPKPGEKATLTWTMAFPSVEESDSELSSLFISCTAPTHFTGIPTCQELIDAVQAPGGAAAPFAVLPMQGGSCKGYEGKSLTVGSISSTCVTHTPKLTVKIEPDSKVRAKLVLGIICRNGTPFLNPQSASLFGCDAKAGVKSSDVETIGVYGTIPIEHTAADANQNPDIGLATLKIAAAGGAVLDAVAAWPETKLADVPAMDDDCKDAAKANLITTADGEVDTIRIGYPAKPRELHQGVAETLEFSVYATAGELERRFTLFPPDHAVVGGQMQDELTWKLSNAEKSAVGPNGKLVRFFFTLLDHDGGYDSTMRAVCVMR
jgi:hypothetical protein